MSERKSVYIHIPFCLKKCVYCDFYSETNLSAMPGYIKSLLKEIKRRSSPGEGIDTVYFGGGTPSLLGIEDTELILKTIRESFIVSGDVEISFEVNPGTVDFEYLSRLRKLGVNRLSIGVQSFNRDKIGFLGRIHSVSQSVETIENSRDAGFENIGIDLIYGVPDQENWIDDLNAATEFRPSHMSCYMLTIETGTRLYELYKKGLVKKNSADELSDLFIMTSEYLRQNGYEHYEISNFALGRKNRSRHNSKYWNMSPYYGFGASAHSFDGDKRFWNHSSIDRYVSNSGKFQVKGREMPDSRQKALEMVMLQLRTSEGLDVRGFEKISGISFKDGFKDVLKSIRDRSLGSIAGGRFKLTLRGKARLDSITEYFAQRLI